MYRFRSTVGAAITGIVLTIVALTRSVTVTEEPRAELADGSETPDAVALPPVRVTDTEWGGASA